MGAAMKSVKNQRGISLLETVFALSLIMVVSLGLLPLGVMATMTTENQGHLAARATEYAQDKLEQLLAVAYGDATADTRFFPAAAGGGSGLAKGGSDDPAAPADLYVDYLKANGDLIPPAAGVPADWYYKRVWKIDELSGSLKKITVVAIVKSPVGSIGQTPRATVVALKSDPF
jgi:type II secretory pathway pseudopilin PulG